MGFGLRNYNFVVVIFVNTVFWFEIQNSFRLFSESSYEIQVEENIYFYYVPYFLVFDIMGKKSFIKLLFCITTHNLG